MATDSKPGSLGSMAACWASGGLLESYETIRVAGRIGFQGSGFKLASLVKNGYSAPGSSGGVRKAGLLEIGVVGGVGLMRCGLFAGCHFCVFPYSQSLV
jgi:hypothetical protein